MDKNKFDIIQEWHELLKVGIITEEDFNKKKQELLKATEVPIAKKEIVHTHIEEVPKITTNKIEENEQIKNDWFNDNFDVIWRISLTIVAIIMIVLIYLTF